MRLTSPAFQHNQSIPSEYTCDGKDMNPLLEWSGVPENTKSLALIVDDPDAPAGLWIHWIVWNVDPKLTRIETNDPLAGAVQGTNTNGNTSYGSPCPPNGTHRYFFKLYALNTILSLSSNSNAVDLNAAMEGHVLDSAELMGTYQRMTKK